MSLEGFAKMSQEIEAADSSEQGQSGEQVLSQAAYENGEGRVEGSDQVMMGILETNEKLVMQYCDQLCNHFTRIMRNLPEHLQNELIESQSIYNDRHDVVYLGMRQRHVAHMKSSSNFA